MLDVRRIVVGTALLSLAIGSAGCRSFRGRKVGDAQPGQEIGGVPVVVQVPRYLKVTYKTADYVIAAKSTGVEREDGTKGTSWQVLGYDRRPEVTTEIVSVGELYALDIDRPFAGTAKNKIEFADGQQFPKVVANDVDDKTLTEVVAGLDKLVGPLTSAAAKPTAGTDAKGGDIEVVKIRETVDKIEFRDVHNPRCVLAEYCPSACATPAAAPTFQNPTRLLPFPTPAK